jgi:hypothetical protein
MTYGETCAAARASIEQKKVVERMLIASYNSFGRRSLTSKDKRDIRSLSGKLEGDDIRIRATPFELYVCALFQKRYMHKLPGICVTYAQLLTYLSSVTVRRIQ